MDKQWHSTGLFAAGAIACGVVIAAYLGSFGSKTPPAAHHVRAAATASALAPAPAAVPAAAKPAVIASTCPSQPLAAARSASDGRFSLDLVLAQSQHADPSAFVSVAKEATDAGRVRDAEVALIAACHVAEQASGGRSAPVADAKLQLGQHYVMLAARENGAAERASLRQRASTLFSESASAYAAALGRNASKTRMAEQRLASLEAPGTLQAAARNRPPPTATMGAAPVTAQRPNVGPDLAPRRTVVPALVQADPQLQLMEDDMLRLRAQAARMSRDKAGMRRRDDYALAQREARCQDKACLMRWYAQRRSQLLAEF